MSGGAQGQRVESEDERYNTTATTDGPIDDRWSQVQSEAV